MSKVKSNYSIIKAPLLTEKASTMMPLRRYAFEVDRRANKIEIRNAIEKIYNVKVTDVRTMTVKGKMTRLRWNQPGKTRTWKKALVSLKEGYEIKLA